MLLSFFDYLPRSVLNALDIQLWIYHRSIKAPYLKNKPTLSSFRYKSVCRMFRFKEHLKNSFDPFVRQQTQHVRQNINRVFILKMPNCKKKSAALNPESKNILNPEVTSDSTDLVILSVQDMVMSCSPCKTPSQVWTGPRHRTGTVPSPDSILVLRWLRCFLMRCLLLCTANTTHTITA